ncbi:MAG: ADP-ribosylglycohydrolase family protein [Gemmataceae bacterium]
MPPLDPDAVVGCLLGQAVGDMMGLPAENLGPRRVAKLFPHFDRPRFLFGYGMGSDDTEHACMTAQALLRSGGDRHRFRRSLAWRLRWWFLAGPPGIGLATLKACVRLWLGWPSHRSGVRSAGNGPAMRAAILFVTAGVEAERERRLGHGMDWFPADPSDWAWFADITRITHTDPQAFAGVMAVYAASLHASSERHQPFDANQLFDSFGLLPGFDLPIQRNIALMRPAYEAGKSVAEFAAELKLTRGVTGYIAHTVPVAVYAFLRHPDDYRTAIESVIRLGGDTDTVAAITGALVGARVGKAGIPTEWLDRWADWPRSVAWMERLALELAEGKWREAPQPAVPLAWWAIPFRNLFFFLVVLAHILRRLLPPY